jgi:hypothetical protein
VYVRPARDTPPAPPLCLCPPSYIVAVLLLWGFISFPLCLIGTVIGRNTNSVPNCERRTAAAWGGRV